MASVMTSLSRYPQALMKDRIIVHSLPGVIMRARVALLRMCTNQPMSMYGFRLNPPMGTQSDKKPYPTYPAVIIHI